MNQTPIRLRDTPYGLVPLGWFITFSLIGGLAGDVQVIAGPQIARDLGQDLSVVGGVFAIVGIFAYAANMVIGWVGDRVRRVPMVGLGTVGVGLFAAMASQASSTPVYTTAEVGVTFTNNGASTPQSSLMADYYPVSVRGRIYALFSGSGTITSVGGLLVGGFLITAFGWRTNLLVLGLVMAVLGASAFFVLKEPARGFFERRQMGLDEAAAQRAEPPRSIGEGWRSFWSVRVARRLWFGTVFSGAGGLPYFVFLPFIYAQTYHLDALGRSLVAVPTALAVLGGSVAGGYIVDYFGQRSPGAVLRVVAIAGPTFAIAAIALATEPPLWFAVTVATVHAFGISLVQPASFSIYSQVLPPATRTQGLQIGGLANIPAQLALALVFSRIAATYGFGPMLLASYPLILIAALINYSAADYFEIDRRNALIATTAIEEARQAQAEGRQRLLVCRKVDVAYDSNQVLFGVDLIIEEGEIVALLGTNGAGKSTLLRAISGIQEAGNGAILLDGRDITHMPPHEIAKRGVVHMPGGRGMFSGMTVEENLVLATWMADTQDVGELLRRAYDLFPILRTRRTQLASALSGGEQQMLSLAQAFLAKPRLLLIDELSLGLSPAVVGELLEKVRAIHAQGTTVVVVEQSVNVALSIAERAVFMEKGEVRFAGPTAELLARPDILRSVYVKGTGGGGRGSSAHDPAAIRRASELSVARPILEVAGVSKRFGGITALEDVNLTLRDGEILGVLGPNGSGKTTLFDIISGYQAADEGTIRLEGRDITSLSAHERARLGLVRRFQDARLFPSLTVQETLLVALDRRLDVRNLAGEALALPVMRRSETRARRRADALIELLSLEAHRDKFVRELSTGLRRILDLAVVLAAEPRVLLLDEPSAGIAQTEAESLGPLLTRVRRETGCSVLIIEHDIPLITAVSDELLAMVTGQVIVRGVATDVLADERVIAAYLGSSEAAIRRSGSIA